MESKANRRAETAEEIIKALVEGYPCCAFRHCLVTGKLNLEGLELDGPVIFEDCVFEEVVDASHAHFGSTLTLRKCIFRKSLTLRGATIDGAFDVSESYIHLPDAGDEFPGESVADLLPDRQTYLYEPPPAWRSAKWNGLTVLGELRGNCLRVEGSLNLGNATIEGNLYLQGCEIGLRKTVIAQGTDSIGQPDENTLNIGGRLYVRQSRIEGDVEMSPWMDLMPRRPLESGDKFPCQQSKIFGSISIGSSIIRGRFNIRGIYIQECLHAIMARISGRVLADCWIHPDDSHGTSKKRTTIGVMRRSEVIEFDAEAAKTISVYFQDTRIEAAVWMRGMKAEGAVIFENARIEGSLQMDVWNQLRTTPELDDLKKWTIYDGHELPEDIAIFQTEIGSENHGEGLKLSNARIGANVDLKGLRAKGRILCHNTEIGGSFLCRPHQITELHWLIRPRIGKNKESKSLSLYGSKVGVNVDLSGAKLEGAVRMRYATVTGAVVGSRMEPKIGTEKELGKDFRPVTEIGSSFKGHGLYLYGADIRGNVCCDDIVTGGYISLELAKITGYARFTKACIAIAPSGATNDRDAMIAGLLFRRATITNDLDFSGAKIWAGVDGTGVDIGGNLRSNGTCIYALRLTPEYPVEQAEEAAENWALERLSQPLYGKLLLIGGRIGGEWSAFGLRTTNTFSVKGLRVGADLNLTQAHLISPDHREPIDGLNEFGLVVVEAREVKLELLKEHALFFGMAVGADCILDTLIVGGSLDLSRCRIAGTLRLSIASSFQPDIEDEPSGTRVREINLSHTNVGTLELTGGSGRPDEGCKLHGLNFQHAILDELAINPELPKGPETPRLSFHEWIRKVARLDWRLVLCFLAEASFYGFLAVLVFLALGVDPTDYTGYVNCLSWNLQTLRQLAAPNGYGIAVFLLWCLFYWGAVWVCRGFHQRAREILSPVFRKERWEGQRGDKAANFIALTKEFAQSPYIAFRRVFEGEGQKEDGAQLYFRMRERELGEHGDHRHSRFTMLFKWVFFVAAGSGVKTKKLCGFLILYFCFSWFAVFSNPDSVEHPSTFVADKVTSTSSEEWKARTGRGYGSSWLVREKKDGQWPFKVDPTQKDRGAEQWNIGDGFWMTLKVHVPLLHLWAKSKWEPASAAGWYYSPFGMRPMWYGMEYETYAVIAQIVSYLLIPMLLTALVNAFLKGHESVEHEHKHGGGHGH